MRVIARYHGSCHCQTVRFHVDLEDIDTARTCNCSFCRMRGVIAVSAPLEGLIFLEGEDNLSLYQFNTHTARHYFCKTCGIHTHYQRRSNPLQLAVNVACIESLNPFEVGDVPVSEGVQHPGDGDGRPRQAGTWRFIPA